MEYKFKDNFRIYRFKKHYASLFPCDMDVKCKQFCLSLDNVDISKPILVLSNEDYMRQSFITLFMKKGFVDYKLMSAYSLLDIYLGNSEEFKTILDINTEVCCIYLGYGEFENKRQVDVLIQLINNQVLQGHTVWIFCRATREKSKDRYPGLVSYFEANKYPVIEQRTGVRKINDEI